ncbi:MAG: hypothetical protein ABFS09_06965 [Thermodesulfobacteriota bacterium]
MKNLLLVTLTTVTMMFTLLLSSGCVKEKQVMGADWYRETPKAAHEKRFPAGHGDAATDKNCHFVEKTNSYFCQFDWFE